MKRYCVIKESFGWDYKREEIKFYYFFKFIAIWKAQRLAKEINKSFYNNDRVFIQKDDVYLNPDREYSKSIGCSWT